MKRIYSFVLFLSLLIGVGFNAGAYTVTINWDNPGSIRIKVGSAIGPYIDLPENATSYEHTWESGFQYLYVYPANDYELASCKLEGSEQNFTASTSYTYTPKAYTISFGSSGDGRVYNVTTSLVNRNETFDFNVVNGLANIEKVLFNSGYEVTLSQGENTVHFNPDFDGTLEVIFQGIEELYEFTLNGDAIEATTPPLKYSDINVNTGDEIILSVYENSDQEQKECNVNFTYGENMIGCITNVYDLTNHKFIFVSADEAEPLTEFTKILENTQLRLDLLSDDFTITSVKVNGTPVTITTNSENHNQQEAVVTITDENTVIAIEGNATVWEDITYTGYISLPEGVEFGLTLDGAYDIAYETNEDAGITVKGMPMKKVTFKVTQKNRGGVVWYKPKDGYFITGLYSSAAASDNDENFDTGSVIDPATEGTTFYMLVEKMQDLYTATVNYRGNAHQYAIDGSNKYADMWGNPSAQKQILHEGENTINFVPNFENPMTINAYTNETPVYLDGMAVTGTHPDAATDTWLYVVDLFAPAVGEESTLHSVVDIFSSGSPSLSNIAMEFKNNATANLYYSAVKRQASATVAGATVAVLQGTPITVKPTSAGAVVFFNGTAVELNADGEYTFDATDANYSIEVTAPQTIDLVGITPKNGTTVRSFNGVTIIAPAMEDDTMMYWTEALGETVVTNKDSGETVATFSELGEVSMDEVSGTGNMLFPILFDKTITEAGTYYIKVPAGAFVQSSWDESAEGYAPVPGGFSSQAKSFNLKVNPDLASVLDTYTLTPAAGSTVKQLDKVNISFDLVAAGSFYNGTIYSLDFVNGDKTITADIILDPTNEEHTAFDIEPAEPITEAGEWTLTIPEGAFTYNDDKNSEIVAKFIVDPNDLPYEITPAPNSTTDNLSTIKIAFKGVETVAYDEAGITLVGPETNLSTTDVHYTGNEATISFRNPTVDGEYTLTIPAGAFSLDGEANEEIVVKYNFKKAWELTPAPGSTVEYLNTLVLSFPEATEVEFVGETYSFLLAKGQVFAVPGMNCVKDETADVPTFTLTLPEGAQEPPTGNYTFSVEEGAFMIDGKPSAEINVRYTVDREASLEYTLTPNGTAIYQDYGFDVAFVFDESTTVSYPDASKIVVTFDDEVVPASDYQMMPEGNYLMFGIYDSKYCKEGTLKISIEAGAFKLGSTDGPAVEGTWNVVAPKKFDVEITTDGVAEDNKVNNLAVIYLHFPEATTGEIYQPSAARLNNSSYSYSQTGKISIVEAETRAAGVTVKIEFDPAPTEADNYYLYVREGAVTLDGVFESPEIEETYIFDSTFTGIESIFADENGNVTVFTLDGRVVLNNVPAAQLRELEKGLYIINGKKTIVK